MDQLQYCIEIHIQFSNMPHAILIFRNGSPFSGYVRLVATGDVVNVNLFATTELAAYSRYSITDVSYWGYIMCDNSFGTLSAFTDRFNDLFGANDAIPKNGWRQIPISRITAIFKEMNLQIHKNEKNNQ